MLYFLYLMLIVLRFCDIVIGNLLFVRKLVVLFESVVRLGCVSVVMRLIVLLRLSVLRMFRLKSLFVLKSELLILVGVMMVMFVVLVFLIFIGLLGFYWGENECFWLSLNLKFFVLLRVFRLMLILCISEWLILVMCICRLICSGVVICRWLMMLVLLFR